MSRHAIHIASSVLHRWQPHRGLFERSPGKQTRLCRRFRSLERKGKRRTVVATAVARELAAFVWAINREVMGNRQA